MPEEQILKLSDAFENKEKESDVELKVRVLNINYGHNKELMEKCRTLKEYAEFVDITRKHISQKKTMQEAIDTAIDYCIDYNILSNFLKKYQAEVLGMLLEEFDVDKYERSIRAEGMEIGIQQGTKIGIQQGTERANKLTSILLDQNRIDDLQRSVQDIEYQEELFREFDL